MRAPTESRDANALKIADDEVGIMARDARMREPRQLGIGDGRAIDRIGQMP